MNDCQLTFDDFKAAENCPCDLCKKVRQLKKEVVVKDDWISVEDRLPEDHMDYEVWEKGSIVPSVAHYLSKKYFTENYNYEDYMEEGWYYSHGYVFDDVLPETPLSVTHWRSLPAPPQTNIISPTK